MIAPVPGSRPMAWGYARVSDDKQIEDGNSVPEQTARILAYYQFKLAPDGVDWARVESDPAGVSATTTLFERRKAGQRLMEAMQPGDHLIIDKLDRICRQPKDLYNIMDWLRRHEMTLHIVNLLGMNIDMNTPMGEFMLGLFGLMARWEAMQISERVRAHNRECRKIGRAISSFPPLGCKHVKVRIPRSRGKYVTYIEWDPKQRAIMQEIVRLWEVEKLSATQIATHIEKHLAEMNGRQFSYSAFYPRTWSNDRVRQAYACEKYIQDHGITDVTELPVGFRDTAINYIREAGYMRDSHWDRERQKKQS